MAPKDKAQELIDAIESILHDSYDNLEAKKIASIFISEITDPANDRLDADVDYWLAVSDAIRHI